MTDERHVWIVGDIDSGAKAGDQKFHTGYCYVLDQLGNRDRKQRVPLSSLPDNFEPCMICAPAKRKTRREEVATAMPPSSTPRITVGDAIELEDTETGAISTVHLVGGVSQPAAGRVSAESPIGVALLGKAVGDTAKAKLPNGSIRTLRVRRFDAPD